MPSDQTQIATIKANTLQQIADLRANPKPSYRIDGQDVSWESYVTSLQATVDWCDQKLAAYGPYEFHSQASSS